CGRSAARSTGADEDPDQGGSGKDEDRTTGAARGARRDGRSHGSSLFVVGRRRRWSLARTPSDITRRYQSRPEPARARSGGHRDDDGRRGDVTDTRAIARRPAGYIITRPPSTA